MQQGPAPDRFLVGLATLGVLCNMAEDGTLVCLIDDAQWLDRASIQVLAFIGRRLAAERFRNSTDCPSLSSKVWVTTTPAACWRGP